MKQMKKMPKIRLFKDIVRDVKHKTTYRGLDVNGNEIHDTTAVPPTLKFTGTVKSHGTNAAVVFQWNPLAFDYEMFTQSKSNIITPVADNMGFATFIHSQDYNKLLDIIMRTYPMDYTPEKVAIFGEWCGGNIQDKVAIHGLEKMFLIFAIKIDSKWLSNEEMEDIKLPAQRIYNILDFGKFHINVDFNEPQKSIEFLDKKTLEVEAECPIGKYFGKSGVGEGIVWKCVEEGYSSSNYWFKVKGQEHTKGSGKIKKQLSTVDVERFDNMKAMIDDLVTERRLEQGFEYLAEMQLGVERKNIGTYIKWVINDVVEEELTTIVENGFEPKELNAYISNLARNAFFEKEKATIGL